MLCEAFQMRLFFSLQPVDIWRVFCCQPFEILSQSGNSPWKSEIYLNWPSFKHTHIWKSVEKCLNLRRWIFSLGLVGCQNTKDVHLTKGCHELKTPKLEWKKICQLFTNNLWFFWATRTMKSVQYMMWQPLLVICIQIRTIGNLFMMNMRYSMI